MIAVTWMDRVGVTQWDLQCVLLQLQFSSCGSGESVPRFCEGNIAGSLSLVIFVDVIFIFGSQIPLWAAMERRVL